MIKPWTTELVTSNGTYKFVMTTNRHSSVLGVFLTFIDLVHLLIRSES